MTAKATSSLTGTATAAPSTSIPPGITAVLNVCRRIYPTQPNPLQASPSVKFWLGGPDPLDYISMYLNAGAEHLAIPEHWHYVTFGLSDLYGDGRIHPLEEQHPDEMDVDGPISGFGFELTFRLKRAAGELTPPLWPADFLQDLARYIFSSSNVFVPGDHVSWHRALDGGENSQSKIQHVLMTTDPQMARVVSPSGRVEFVQAVGVCKEELEAAQHWNGRGVLELLRSCKTACGPMWITDIRRDRSIFELDSHLALSVQDGINRDGSDLSGVSCSCRWTEIRRHKHSRSGRSLSLSDTNQIRAALQNGLADNDPSHIKFLDSVHLSFNQEAGSLLGLALCGRLLHGRHFTFRNVTTDHAITFVAEEVRGTAVSRERPLAVAGNWLQVYLQEKDIMEMAADVRVLTMPEKFLPYRLFSWPNLRLNVTVCKDETLFAI
ncbi:Suppressor of fused-like protein [Hypsibius exemplaris]|uniref:Suppressor of fused-like protein n=1 Tax=Hypsibius exemplaris TaxID=2072580 RepID=A0A1W0WRT0_HYPEX|nr:Suppressor of fused-like protein [Hypsibius exemplaris]